MSLPALLRSVRGRKSRKRGRKRRKRRKRPGRVHHPYMPKYLEKMPPVRAVREPVRERKRPGRAVRRM